METIHFKTNIKCSGCVAKVTPELDKTVGVNKWTVDLQSADKILTVPAEAADSKAVQDALQRVGYQAETINHN